MQIKSISALSRNVFKIVYLMLFFFLSYVGPIYSLDEKNAIDQKPANMQIVINKVRDAVKTKDFTILKQYVPKGEQLYWVPCEANDLGPDEIKKLSIESINGRLLELSKDAEIYIHGEPDINPANPEKTAFTIALFTDGWSSEYPYLIFNFLFRKNDGQWEWKGVCDSSGPPLKITKDGQQYKEVYYREPKLPRSGPRVFKDYSALKARIKEIIQFKKFNSIKPYAIKKTLIFGQCNDEMMKKDSPEGKVKSVDKIIDFLQKNASGTEEIKFSGVTHKTYYETVGWSGEYPVIAFWISEGKDGWYLAGVSYCKTKHIDVLFSNETRLK